MFKTPRTCPPVGPGRMALRFEKTHNGRHCWSIVVDDKLHGSTLVGWRRGPGENFAGQYAYRFRTWAVAHRVLLKLQAGHPIQDGKA
jgi:hypothetical protein